MFDIEIVNIFNMLIALIEIYDRRTQYCTERKKIIIKMVIRFYTNNYVPDLGKAVSSSY